jgi:hypothetical protein
LKISLAQQIDEIARELDERKRVYPRLIATRKIRESVAAYQTARLEAAHQTLLWLRRNELLIKQRLAD